MFAYKEDIKEFLLDAKKILESDSQALVIESWGSSGHISEDECYELYDRGDLLQQQADDINSYLIVNGLIAVDKIKPTEKTSMERGVLRPCICAGSESIVGDDLPF